jgi:hypothetical protein
MKDQLREYFLQNTIHPSFEEFNKVSERLYARIKSIGEGVCYTCVFRCYSEGAVWKTHGEWANNLREIYRNCFDNLVTQIDQYACHMKLILCNGAKVVDAVRKALSMCGFAPVTDHFTSTEYGRNGQNIFMINSGSIERIDDFARRRLGHEIEQIAEKIGVQL